MLVAATTSLVLVAFLVPLALLLLRTVAADRAVQATTAQVQTLSALVATAGMWSRPLAAPAPPATYPAAARSSSPCATRQAPPR